MPWTATVTKAADVPHSSGLASSSFPLTEPIRDDHHGGWTESFDDLAAYLPRRDKR